MRQHGLPHLRPEAAGSRQRRAGDLQARELVGRCTCCFEFPHEPPLCQLGSPLLLLPGLARPNCCGTMDRYLGTTMFCKECVAESDIFVGECS